ncbi:LysR family transcriptional regulator [Aureimonas sp. OT7]|uniref:LysR family transcriptional regulator n=1 Tax=Aureimonas TaxID=414371 RepID=UPI0017836D1D|nr:MULTISPECIES: LysR family transcriptional regulator [Aureimonas]QOG07302.1 LysR family transcriptional regulator [Aureimonas sp. OT7]
MLDLRRLKYFAAIAQHGSMAAAARALNVAQPALSHHTAELERTIGFPLFERLPRGVKLTEGGRLLLDHALIILAQVAEAEQAVRAHRKPAKAHAMVRLGLLPSWSAIYGDEIRRVVGSLYPDLSVLIFDLRHDEAIRMITTEEVDLAVVLEAGEDAELMEALACEQMYAVSSSVLPPTMSLAQLSAHHLVLTTRMHPDHRTLHEHAHKTGVPLRIILEVDGQKTLVKALVQGLGVGVMSKNGARAEIEAGILHASAVTEPRLTRSIFLQRSARTRLEFAREFHRLIRSVARNGPGTIRQANTGETRCSEIQTQSGKS